MTVARVVGHHKSTLCGHEKLTHARWAVRSSWPAEIDPPRRWVRQRAARRSFTAGKQRLTATRLWELLREDGHEVSARTVRRLVTSLRNAEREVTVPLVCDPGDLAQADFFEVWEEVAAKRRCSFSCD